MLKLLIKREEKKELICYINNYILEVNVLSESQRKIAKSYCYIAILSPMTYNYSL